MTTWTREITDERIAHPLSIVRMIHNDALVIEQAAGTPPELLAALSDVYKRFISDMSEVASTNPRPIGDGDSQSEVAVISKVLAVHQDGSVPERVIELYALYAGAFIEVAYKGHQKIEELPEKLPENLARKYAIGGIMSGEYEVGKTFSIKAIGGI